MQKRFLSFEDLYSYFENNNQNVTFNAKNDNASIVVHIDEPLVFETQESDDNKMIVNLKLCHTLKNLNMSYISKEAMQNALPSAYNMPILGYIWEDEDGVAKFAGHEFYMNDDDEIVYEEQPIGCIPESGNLRFVESEEEGDDKEYVACSGIIWRTYSKAAEIMEREKNLSVSIEIDVDELSYMKDPDGGKNGLLNIKSFSFDGVTILQEKKDGSGQSINPGMSGACISLEDFSKKENSMFSQEIVQKLDELKDKLDNLSDFEINIKPKTKGGENVQKEFETEDAVVEAEAQEEAVVEEEVFEEANADDADVAEEVVEAETFEEDDVEGDAEDVSVDAVEAVESEAVADATEGTFSKAFELSHSDVKAGLYALLSQFEESDNDWYGIVNVFDDYFIYQGMFDTSHCFKQEYTKEGDQIQFTNDRIHLNSEYLTDNELAELNAMRSNYAEISEKLAKYEAEPQKVEKIESDEYSMIRDTDEFKEIENNHFDLSVDEIAKALDDTVLKYAKANKLNYSVKTEGDKVERKLFSTETSAKTGKYDALFKK